MNVMQQLLTEHIDIWTAAETEKKSGRGRAAGNAGSVYGIKKLRELILELAVRGKLVPQDANDEPASELIKRIYAFKVKQSGNIRLQNKTPLFEPYKEDDGSDLPQNWKAVRFGELVCISTGKLDASAAVENGNYPFFTCSQTPSRIDSYAFDTSAVLLAGNGDFNIKFYQGKFNAYQRTYVIEPVLFDLKFCFFLVSARIQTITKNNRGSAIPYLKLGDLTEPIFALPPLPEQHRIVAKVDELMTLCDQLENRHINAADAHEKLVSHLLGTLTQSQNAADFSANWQRIAAHFDTLFTTEASIDAVKQTLLQLAVMGKLVPQSENDEPASELLKRIQAEKARLIAEGKIKKEKPLAPIAEEEKQFDLPQGWDWGRLGNIVENSGAGWSPSCEGHPRTGNDWGVLKVSAVSWGRFLPEENKALPQALDPRLDCVVKAGDFLVSRANTAELVARSVIVEDCPVHLMLSDKIVRLRLSSHCNSQFINLANLSSFARNYYSAVAGGTSSSMKNVSREQILNLVICLPPLSEQHRIVAKVNELTALCDQLKSRITAVSQLQQRLADVLVNQAVA